MDQEIKIQKRTRDTTRQQALEHKFQHTNQLHHIQKLQFLINGSNRSIKNQQIKQSKMQA